MITKWLLQPCTCYEWKREVINDNAQSKQLEELFYTKLSSADDFLFISFKKRYIVEDLQKDVFRFLRGSVVSACIENFLFKRQLQVTEISS